METLTNEQDTPQDSILDDVLDTREYDKKVKTAQNTIFVVAAVQLVVGILLAFTGAEELRNFQIGAAAFIATIFFGLGMWCKSKPFTAIIIALSLYVGLLILDAFFDPVSIVKGLIMKIFIIGYLIKGIGAAKAAQELKNIGKL